MTQVKAQCLLYYRTDLDSIQSACPFLADHNWIIVADASLAGSLICEIHFMMFC